ncbi:MAG TPA: NAD(P)H-dependent oxidoreductase [Actinophytocola sp.]|uniref:NADPH-dependent FMN reductase n=1 Tax=Actinophytocola sp. TaxID=1872138 RepID=UPI002DDD05CD|nr:NAD(P)H-dependent oxidoreductase [Actinophytocola sp.]HEV2777860.1 NAD(P)H-dependent oxidoreductase [Actinophytocola sp.]
MARDPLRVAVIIGSTRQGRVGDRVGRWFGGLAARRADVEVTVVDLADFAFPASYPDTATPPMIEFAGRVGAADAFVIVTPEYNRSFPASLKQAIDFAYDEWRAKPVGFVSYGCGSTGVYAVEQLRGVFTELQATTVRNSVGFNLLDGGFDERCRPPDPDRAARAATTMLDQLIWWGCALRDARAARPYVS